MEFLRVEPVDTVFLRGNRSFAAARHADAVMPPWPSLFAGALRSRILADHDAIRRFSESRLDGRVGEVVGRGPDALGTFRVAGWALMLEREGSTRLVLPPPADLVVTSDGPGERRTVHRLSPVPTAELDVASGLPRELGALAVLRTRTRGKPETAWWVSDQGWTAWARGETPAMDALVAQGALWATETRLGIALDERARTAREGMIYTSETVSLAPGVAFLVAVEGADGVLPSDGLLRFGGDGRAASVSRAKLPVECTTWTHRPSSDRFVIALATPGIFPDGWLPPYVVRRADGSLGIDRPELRARLVAALVPRPGVASGWDLAASPPCPKPALRYAPAGSLYFFEREGGDVTRLRSIVDDAVALLPAELPHRREYERRRSEGWGTAFFGDWKTDADRP